MKINDSDLFFTCSLIELIGRSTKQKRSAVVVLLGKKVLSHIYSNAGVLHCEPIAKNADAFIEMCNIPEGTFDNVADCKYEVPDYWTIGKVFARLIEDVASGNAIETLQEVYLSPVCDAISNYNSDFFYQPRGFIKEFYLDECKNSPKKRKTPALRFAGFTDAWEQRKLGELAPLRGGFAFQSQEYCTEGVPIVKISNILSDGMVGGEFDYYAELKDDHEFTLPNGAAVLAMSGATTGKVAILLKKSNQKYYQNQRVGYFTSTRNVEYSFITTIVRSDLFIEQLKSVLVAGAQPNVSPKDIDSFEFSFPKSKNEQHKIGQIFQSLDRLITLHQREQIFDEL